MSLIPYRDLNLPNLFLEEVRNAYFEGRPSRFRSINLIAIAENAVLRDRFLRLCRTQINDPELKRLVVLYFRDTATTLEREARLAVPWSETLDRYVAPMSGAVAVTGLVALTGVASAAAPFLLVGGLTVLGVSGTTSIIIKRSAAKNLSSAEAMRQLIEDLKEQHP